LARISSGWDYCMIVILGLDALDLSCVNKFNCRNLMQQACGKRICGIQRDEDYCFMVVFLAEMNMEKEISRQGSLWDYTLPQARTFFRRFKKYRTLDVPGFSYDLPQHELERQKLKDFLIKKARLRTTTR